MAGTRVHLTQNHRIADRSAWLAPLLVGMGVLLPTGGVLWFMNQAARSQADSARRSVYEAYRDQLRFLRERLDAAWQGRAVELERAAGDGAVSNLPAAIKATGAEAVVLLDASGATRFPV